MSLPEEAPYPHRTTSSGLSKAYAVLRQLEFLRQQDILHPVGVKRPKAEGTAAPSPAAGEEAPVRRRAQADTIHEDEVLHQPNRGSSSSGTPPRQDKAAQHDEGGHTSGVMARQRLPGPAAAADLVSPVPHHPRDAALVPMSGGAPRPILAPQLFSESPQRPRQPPQPQPPLQPASSADTSRDALQSITRSPTHISIDPSYGRSIHQYDELPPPIVSSAAASEGQVHYSDLRRSELLRTAQQQRRPRPAAERSSPRTSQAAEDSSHVQQPPFFPEAAHKVDLVVQGRRDLWTSQAATEVSAASEDSPKPLSAIFSSTPSSFFFPEQKEKKKKRVERRREPQRFQDKECYFDDSVYLPLQKDETLATRVAAAAADDMSTPNHSRHDGDSFFDTDDVQEALRHTARSSNRYRERPSPLPEEERKSSERRRRDKETSYEEEERAPSSVVADTAVSRSGAAPPASSTAVSSRRRHADEAEGEQRGPADLCGEDGTRTKSKDSKRRKHVDMDTPEGASGAIAEEEDVRAHARRQGVLESNRSDLSRSAKSATEAPSTRKERTLSTSLSAASPKVSLSSPARDTALASGRVSAPPPPPPPPHTPTRQEKDSSEESSASSLQPLTSSGKKKLSVSPVVASDAKRERQTSREEESKHTPSPAAPAAATAPSPPPPPPADASAATKLTEERLLSPSSGVLRTPSAIQPKEGKKETSSRTPQGRVPEPAKPMSATNTASVSPGSTPPPQDDVSDMTVEVSELSATPATERRGVREGARSGEATSARLSIHDNRHDVNQFAIHDFFNRVAPPPRTPPPTPPRAESHGKGEEKDDDDGLESFIPTPRASTEEAPATETISKDPSARQLSPSTERSATLSVLSPGVDLTPSPPAAPAARPPQEPRSHSSEPQEVTISGISENDTARLPSRSKSGQRYFLDSDERLVSAPRDDRDSSPSPSPQKEGGKGRPTRTLLSPPPPDPQPQPSPSSNKTVDEKEKTVITVRPPADTAAPTPAPANDEVPVKTFLRAVTTATAHKLEEELRAMAGTCNSGGVESFTDDSLALTLLLNRPDVLRRLVVPLLTAELAAASSHAAGGTSRSRQAHVLCALIGLGALAQDALPLLLDCLTHSEGDSRLVALAVRTSGGVEGIDALCRLVRDRTDAPALQQAAAWGLSALPVDVVGHTTVVCAGGLSHALHFYPSKAGAGYEEVHTDPSQTEVVTLQEAPPYVPTNLLLHNDEARQAMLVFVVSEHFHVMHSYPRLATVLADIVSDETAAAVTGQLVEEKTQKAWQAAQAQLQEELAPLLDPAEVLVLPYAYRSCFRDHRELLFRVEQCLVTAAVEATEPFTREQALISLASLPAFAREHCAEAVRDILTNGLQTFERTLIANGKAARGNARGSPQEDAEEAVLVAAEVALGVVCTPQACSLEETESCVGLLLRLLTSPRWRLRHGACVGLGHLAPRHVHTETIVAELLQRLADTSVSPDTVVWALVRQGPCGLRKLLDVLRVATLPVTAHIACARGLAQVETALLHCDEAAAERDKLHEELADSVGELIISAGPLEEVVVLECVQGLAKGLGGWRCHGDDEAINTYEQETPPVCYTVLRALLEATVLPYAVHKALFLALCRYGGAHGEAYACHEAMESLHLASRAAAAFALRVCGGKVIRTVAVAINDPAAEVRREGLDTLQELGVEEIMRVLRQRPAAHRQQVTAALRDALLRDVGKGKKYRIVQQLYETLTTMP